MEEQVLKGGREFKHLKPVSASASLTFYKPSGHFYSIHQLPYKSNVKINGIFGIAGHGKESLTMQIADSRLEIAAGKFFKGSQSMVNFLQNKLKNQCNPSYKVKEIDQNYLQNISAEAIITVFKTVEGSH